MLTGLTGFSIETLQIAELKKELMNEIRILKEEMSQIKNEIDELKGSINYKHYKVGGPG